MRGKCAGAFCDLLAIGVSVGALLFLVVGGIIFAWTDRGREASGAARRPRRNGDDAGRGG